MDESLTNLLGFIQDFDLRKPSGAVYFNATIVLTIDGDKKVEHSEVHIITSDNLGTIYFLNPAINAHILSDYFDVKKHLSIYITGQSLKLECHNYIISIHPQVD